MRKKIFFILICILNQILNAAIIKPNSVIDILVQDHKDFSGRFTIDKDGMIDYPLFADEHIVDLTTSELMTDLTYRLAKHIDNPLVLISIVKRPPIVVTVLGAVMNPGPVDAVLGATVQEVIQLAGGTQKKANLEVIKIIHQGEGENISEYVNLNEFLIDGNIKDMPKLRNNDIVILLSKKASSKVKVIGAVKNPGFYEPEDDMSIFEIIYLAGGPSEKADLSRVRRFSKYEGKTTEELFDLKAYMDKGEMDNIPKVQEGDIIIVYGRWFDWKIFMTVITNVLLFIVTIQTIKTAVSN